MPLNSSVPSVRCRDADWALCLLPALVALSASAGQPPIPPPPPSPPGLEHIPETVARVDHHAIRRNELIRELVGAVGRETVEQLAQRMLVEQAAVKAGIEVTEKELGEQLQYEEATLAKEEILPPWEAWDKSFAALVRARYQMTVEEYKNQLVRQKLLVRKIVGKDIRPSEAQLRAYFTERQDLFQARTRYRAAHILITPLTPQDLFLGGRLASSTAYRQRLAEDRKRREQRLKLLKDRQVDMSNAPEADPGPDWAACRARAMECLGQLRAGRISWEKAVEQYTQDPHDLPSVVNGRPVPPLRQRLKQPLQPGEVGWFTRDGPLVVEFHEAIRNLKVGQITEPVRTSYGFHIIKLLEVAQPPQAAFEELRAQVERYYVDGLIRSLVEEWLNREVKAAKLQWTLEKLWPPALGAGLSAEADPVVCQVNGQPLRRSLVWKEMLRTDGPEGLQRLVNREIALGPLKNQGPARLEWNGLPAHMRNPKPPPDAPIAISLEELDQALNSDRLRCDAEKDERRRKEPMAPPFTWEQFLREQYGQTPEEHRRAVETGLVLAKAVKQRAPCDEGSLRFHYSLSLEVYKEPLRFEVSHILVAPAGDDLEHRLSAVKLAQEFREQLVKGNVKWEDLVAKHSDDEETRTRGGRLGQLGPDSRDYPELYQALLNGNFEPGQLTTPLKSSRGFHLVRVERKLSERILQFEDVKAAVQRDYLAGRAEMYLGMWVRAMQHQARVHRYVYQREPAAPPDHFPPPEK